MRAVFPETDGIDDFSIDTVLSFDDRKRAARAFLTGRAHEPFLCDLAKRLMGMMFHVYVKGKSDLNENQVYLKSALLNPKHSRTRYLLRSICDPVSRQLYQ